MQDFDLIVEQGYVVGSLVVVGVVVFEEIDVVQFELVVFIVGQME